MDKFSIKFSEELVTRFLTSAKRESTHTIITAYQSDISWELRDLLKDLLFSEPNIDELESCINIHCSKDVTVHVYSISKSEIVLQIIKTPRSRI